MKTLSELYASDSLAKVSLNRIPNCIVTIRLDKYPIRLNDAGATFSGTKIAEIVIGGIRVAHIRYFDTADLSLYVCDFIETFQSRDVGSFEAALSAPHINSLDVIDKNQWALEPDFAGEVALAPRGDIDRVREAAERDPKTHWTLSAKCCEAADDILRCRDAAQIQPKLNSALTMARNAGLHIWVDRLREAAAKNNVAI